jgi:hypothetical protein
MWRSLLLHMCLLQPLEVSKMRRKTSIVNSALGRRDREGIVRIRRKIKEHHYLGGKSVYKYQRTEMTIPSKFKDIVEPFLYTDLKVEARREGNNLIIEAKPIERLV